MRDLWIRRP